jgi:hypothetical protein
VRPDSVKRIEEWEALVLKYPDGGFILLMIFAMAILGQLAGLVLPHIISGGPGGRLSSIIDTVIFACAFVAGSYYLAKLMAWVLFRLRLVYSHDPFHRPYVWQSPTTVFVLLGLVLLGQAAFIVWAIFWGQPSRP